MPSKVLFAAHPALVAGFTLFLPAGLSGAGRPDTAAMDAAAEVARIAAEEKAARLKTEKEEAIELSIELSIDRIVVRIVAKVATEEKAVLLKADEEAAAAAIAAERAVRSSAEKEAEAPARGHLVEELNRLVEDGDASDEEVDLFAIAAQIFDDENLPAFEPAAFEEAIEIQGVKESIEGPPKHFNPGVGRSLYIQGDVKPKDPLIKLAADFEPAEFAKVRVISYALNYRKNCSEKRLDDTKLREKTDY